MIMKGKSLVLILNIIALLCVIAGFVLIEFYMKTAATIIAAIGIIIIGISEYLIFKKL